MNTNLRLREYTRFLSLHEAYGTLKESIWCLCLSVVIVQVCLMRLYFSNIYFLDDIPRAFSGGGWNIACRPLSTFIMQVLSGGSFIQDLSPVTQIAGSFLVILSAYLLSLSFLRKEISKYFRIIFIIIIALNPYMLEIYSFRYDSLPYSMGFFFAVSAYFILFELAGYIKNRLSSILNFIIAAISLCVGALFYQPVISLFIVAGSFKLFILGISDQLSAKHGKVTILFLSCIVLSLIVAKYFQILLIADSTWFKDQTQFTPIHLFSNLYFNTLKAWNVFMSDWFSKPNIFSLFLTICLINTVLIALSFMYTTVKKNRGLSKGLFARYLYLFFWFLAGCSLGLYGLIAILDNAHMRPRTFISAGAALAILLYLPYSFGLRTSIYRTFSLTVISSLGLLSVLTFALIWGNAIAAQSIYQNAVEYQLSQDIYSLRKDQGKISFMNGVGLSPAISKNLLKRYPLIERLIASTGKGYWQFKRIRLAIGLPIVAADACQHELQPLLIDRLDYSIRDCDSRLTITFKEGL